MLPPEAFEIGLSSVYFYSIKAHYLFSVLAVEKDTTYIQRLEIKSKKKFCNPVHHTFHIKAHSHHSKARSPQLWTKESN